jgi:hypothetical protein
MAQWRAYPSAWSTGVNNADRTWVDAPESVGRPTDAAASDVTANNSAFALGKGILFALDVPAGSGNADTNDNAKVYADPLVTLGETSDVAAIDTGSHSAISFLKGILAQAGI